MRATSMTCVYFISFAVNPVVEFMMRDFCRVLQGRSGAVRDQLDVNRTLYYQRKLELPTSGSSTARYIQNPPPAAPPAYEVPHMGKY
jgi:hypothetical protein